METQGPGGNLPPGSAMAVNPRRPPVMMVRVFFIDIMFEQHTLHGDSGASRQTPPRVGEGGESTEAPGDDG